MMIVSPRSPCIYLIWVVVAVTALGLLLPRLLLERHALVCTQTQPPPPHNRRYTGLSIWPCSFTKRMQSWMIDHDLSYVKYQMDVDDDV